MHSFLNDYSEGAHPRILQALIDTNLKQEKGYGEDRYSEQAKTYIKKAMNNDTVDIHFLSGGTQTNLTAISAFLKPHQAAISANSGHILVHETGAIEATGHKVLSIPTENGKITADSIAEMVLLHTDEHMVKPALVYLSQSTEVGSIYSKSELLSIKTVCKNHELLLYIDGARLGSALCSIENNVTLADLSGIADAFYIGGTKNGALIGEALVIINPELKKDFRFHLKQKGALLAKGRLLSIQFCELFRDDLFFDLAQHANTMAQILHDGLYNQGYRFMTHSPTNQIFPILPNELIQELLKNFDFHVWTPIDNTMSSIRLVTSWATEEQDITKFLEATSKK